jgi:surface-anchored protein
MQRSGNFLRAVLGASLLAGLTFGAPAQAQLIPNPPVLTNQHVDLGIAYEDDAWDLHVHNETDDIEYAPNEVLLGIGPAARMARPAGSAFDFIGVGAGENFWLLPEANNPDVLFLGIGSEEIESGVFDTIAAPDARVSGAGEWLTLSLHSVLGPGDFSIWSEGDLGPIVFMATSDGIGMDDKVFVVAGGHSHFNFGFTAPGIYEVTVSASGFINGQMLQSDPVTYYFGVEAVPEPGVVALLAGSALPAFCLLRRRQSRRP